jgi:hypothetical protein
MSGLGIDHTFVKDYLGVSIYKNANYSKWLENGKYVAEISHFKIAGDSISYMQSRIKEIKNRFGKLKQFSPKNQVESVEESKP